MTTAGVISVGVEIVANGLGEKLAASVRAQLTPALAQINTELGRINGHSFEKLTASFGALGDVARNATREIDGIDRAINQLGADAAKSGAKQVGANKAAADSMKPGKQVAGYEAIAKAAKNAAEAIARVAAAESARDDIAEHSGRRVAAMEAESLAARSEADEMRKLSRATNAAARAVDRLAAANAKAAAGPKPKYDTPIIPRTPTGGGGGGGRAGGFGGGGMLGALLSPAGITAISLGTKTLAPMALGIAEVTRSIQDLAGAGGLLPGVIGGMVASIGTAKVGFLGVGDAVSEMWKAMNEGDPKKAAKDWQKFEQDIQGLAPSARETVLALKDLGKPLQELQQTVQGNMFADIAGPLKQTVDTLLPSFKTGLSGIATAWNGTFKSILGVAGSDSSKSFLDRIFGNTAEAQTRANAAIAPMIHAFGTLTAQSTNFLPRLADGLTKVSTRFDNFISGAVADGSFDRWVDNGMKAVADLGESFLNVGKILNDITSSLGGGQTFLGWLRDATGDLHTFLTSADGQQKLSSFFDSAREEWSQIKPVLVDIAKLAGDVVAGFHEWGGVILPVVSGITDALASMPKSIAAVVTAYAGLKTIKGISYLVGLTAILGGGKAGAAGWAGGSLLGAAGSAGAARSFLGGPIGWGLGGAGLLYSGISSSAGPGGVGWGSAASTIGGGALLGASIGSVIPGIGTGIGAAVGAAAGVITVAGQALAESVTNVNDPINSFIDSLKAGAAISWEHIKKATGQEDNPTPGFIPGQNPLGAAPADAFEVIGLDGRLIPLDPNNPNDIDRLRKGIINNPFSPLNIPHDAEGKTPTITNTPGSILDQNVFASGFPNIIPQTPLPQSLVGLPPVLPANTLAPDSLSDLFTGGAPIPRLNPQEVVPNPAIVNGSGPVWSPGRPMPLQVDPKTLGDVADLTQSVTKLGDSKLILQTDPGNVQKIQGELKGLGGDIVKVGADNKIEIDAKDDAARKVIADLINEFRNRSIPLTVTATPNGAPLPGHALGGAIAGGIPGRDSVPALLMPGEHVLTTADVAALGGQAGVYALRAGLHNGLRRFATGGAVLGAGDGVPGGLGNTLGVDDNTVIGLLTQIRDALVGRGSSGSPLAQTAANTSTMAQALGPKAKPFGGDVGKGALAGAIRALGGDPNLMDWGGYDGNGQLLVPRGGVGGSLMGPGVSPAAVAALQAFALSGNTSDLGGGLKLTDPVVKAVVTARNKKKGLGAGQISDLIGQVLGGGGFQGTLDSTNTALVNALSTYQQKQNKPVAGGGVAVAGFDQALLSQVSPGRYTQGQADLTKGLADCSSAVEGLVNLMDGAPTAGRTLNTGNAPEWLAAHGFMPGTMPGAFNVGFNASHMQATLPGGTPFNWGSDAAAARGGVGGTGAEDPAFTQHWYRPVAGMPAATGLAAGTSNPLGYSGGPVPVYIVDGPGATIARDIAGNAVGALAGPLGNVAGDIVDGINAGTPLARSSTLNKPGVDTNTLIAQGNPAAVGGLLGYKVPDFTRAGWSGQVMTNGGPGYTANGQMMTNTTDQVLRTFTDTAAALDARQQQMMAVLDQIKNQLSSEVLKPIIQDAVQQGIQAAGVAIQGKAAGGPIYGGTPGVDSVPALLMPGEHVLTASDVSRMGGQAGVYAFRRALYAHGGHVRLFANGGSANATVGADFFGLSQVPIIGPLINLLIQILLSVIGVNVQAANTLNSIDGKFEKFRGDFMRYTASGQIISDTGSLSDRHGSSEQKAVDERVRIFKQVLSGLIQFIVQKIIIPIVEAVGQSLLSAASSAISGAISGGLSTVAGPAGPIAGNLVGGLINSAGGAAINIIGEIAQQIAGAAIEPIINLLTGGLLKMFGGLLHPILTGGIAGLLSPFLGILGIAFDDGGVASGIGLMPKATIEPERVLSPRQTSNHERLTDLLDSGALDRITAGGKTVTIHAPIHVYGNEQGAREVHNHLMSLID